MRYNIRITTMHACSSDTLPVTDQSTTSMKHLTAGMTSNPVTVCRHRAGLAHTHLNVLLIRSRP